MREQRYHVYIVASRSHTLYIGMTSALNTRIQQHKHGAHEGFSKQYNCNRLVYLETHDFIANAINREKQLKRWSRAKKLALIDQQNPAWVDLSESWTNRSRCHTSNVTPQLHTELWTSWASLLRAYAGAHGLNATHHAVTEVGAQEILLRVDTRVLRFTPTQATLPNAPAVPFSLNEDGTATLNGETDEMDLLAERLAREMMHPTP